MLREEKKRFLSGIARMRGGVYPCPDFLAPFFCQVTVLKMAIFYSNFTVIVCFLVIFVIIIIKITKIIIIIIIETIIIIIQNNFGHTRKTPLFFFCLTHRVLFMGTIFMPFVVEHVLCSRLMALSHELAFYAFFFNFIIAIGPKIQKNIKSIINDCYGKIIAS